MKHLLLRLEPVIWLLFGAGLSVGTYTSPHLLRYHERVRIDGVEADDASLVAAFEAVEAARSDEAGTVTPLTYFEYGTLAALWLFARRDLDLAVLLRPKAPGGKTDFLQDLASALERFSPTGAVDILMLGQQGPVLRHRVLAEGRLIHDADPEARVEFEGRTIAEYLDWKPTHDIAMRSALSGLRDRLRRATG